MGGNCRSKAVSDDSELEGRNFGDIFRFIFSEDIHTLSCGKM